MINKRLLLISYILLSLLTFLFFQQCTHSGKEKGQSIDSSTENILTSSEDTTSYIIKNYEINLSGKFIRVDYLLSGEVIIPVYCDAVTEEIEWVENKSKLSINWGQAAEIFRVTKTGKSGDGYEIYGINNADESTSIKIKVIVHDATNRISFWVIERNFANDKLINELFMVDSDGRKKIQLYKFLCEDDGK
ncbi:MAG: hypothetical protein ACK57K_03105 [Chryseotalea sp.]|jgi:hypothetical protein|nr:hypothetical protein [Flammeovirgaceae bacterium]